MKQLIINADDFGYSIENNEAIIQGMLSGVITSASIMPNMPAFKQAIEKIETNIPQIDMGIHLNIIEGKSLTNPSLLCDSNGNFNKGYGYLILNSFNKKLLNEIEKEFRAQIEEALKFVKISHIDSHVHTHAIPNLFKLTIKLAEEYNIPYVRTQREIPYITPNKFYTIKFLINTIKNFLLNIFTLINLKAIKNSKIKTNNYFIGVLYTGNMDENTIKYGLKKIKKENSITEIIFHPYIKNTEEKSYNYKEFLMTQNPNFKDFLKNSDFVLSTYSN